MAFPFPAENLTDSSAIFLLLAIAEERHKLTREGEKLSVLGINKKSNFPPKSSKNQLLLVCWRHHDTST